MVYLIQGFFFQDHEWLDIAMVPVEGAVAVIKSGLGRWMFSGIIFPGTESFLHEGTMIDQIGESRLSRVRISPTRLEYVKKYHRRDDLIDYEFDLKDGIWVGKYSGEAVGEGGATCILTEVKNQDLFRPPNMN